MAARLRPRKWDLLGTCSPKCSLNIENLGEERALMVHGWFEQGLNDKTISKNAVSAGFPLSHGAVGRHRANHLEPKGETYAGRSVTKSTDLEIIEGLIQVGGQRLDEFKVTPSELMKAMELKYKMTQGSAFESMLDALARAAADEDDEDEDEDDLDS